MIYNTIFALISAFSFVHNVNTIKEDYNSSYTDCKVWGFEDGSWASKARWGVKMGLDSIGAASSGLLFVDSVSGGNIRTKAVREFLGGFESSSDLKEKCSKVGILGKDEPIKESQLMKIESKAQPISVGSIDCGIENKDSLSAQEQQKGDTSENCASEQVNYNENNKSECSSEESSVDDFSSDSSNDSYESENEIPAPVAV